MDRKDGVVLGFVEPLLAQKFLVTCHARQFTGVPFVVFRQNDTCKSCDSGSECLQLGSSDNATPLERYDVMRKCLNKSRIT